MGQGRLRALLRVLRGRPLIYRIEFTDGKMQGLNGAGVHLEDCVFRADSPDIPDTEILLDGGNKMHLGELRRYFR